MTYKVEKHKIDLMDTKPVEDFGGGYDLSDVKAITKGYRKTERLDIGITFYERKGSNFLFVVKDEQ